MYTLFAELTINTPLPLSIESLLFQFCVDQSLFQACPEKNSDVASALDVSLSFEIKLGTVCEVAATVRKS